MKYLLLLSFLSLGITSQRSSFHLLNLRRKTGGTGTVLHYAQTPQHLHPVCMNQYRPVGQNEALLSHKLCRGLGFQTVSNQQLVSISIFPGSTDVQLDSSYSVECSQNRLDYNISCQTVFSHLPCTHLLQVECGDCYYTHNLRENDTLVIRSPLYPVLQPNMICKYDILLEGSQTVGELELGELSLADPTLSILDNRNHCLNSFLQIQSGSSEATRTWLDTLCGEKNNSVINNLGAFTRLLLVTGRKSPGKAGFQVGFRSTVEPSVLKSKVFLFFVTFFSVFIGFGGLLACFGVIFKKKFTSRRKRRVQLQRSAWQRDLSAAGQSVHQDRSIRLLRLLEAQENNYIMDNRVPAVSSLDHRPLPDIPRILTESPCPRISVENFGVDLTSSHQYQTLFPQRIPGVDYSPAQSSQIYSFTDSEYNYGCGISPPRVTQKLKSPSYVAANESDSSSSSPRYLKLLENPYLSILSSGSSRCRPTHPSSPPRKPGRTCRNLFLTPRSRTHTRLQRPTPSMGLPSLYSRIKSSTPRFKHSAWTLRRTAPSPPPRPPTPPPRPLTPPPRLQPKPLSHRRPNYSQNIQVSVSQVPPGSPYTVSASTFLQVDQRHNPKYSSSRSEVKPISGADSGPHKMADKPYLDRHGTVDKEGEGGSGGQEVHRQDLTEGKKERIPKVRNKPPSSLGARLASIVTCRSVSYSAVGIGDDQNNLIGSAENINVDDEEDTDLEDDVFFHNH